TTGQFHAVPGFSCGTDEISGFIYANATCIFTPTTITGRLLGPTTFALPATGSYTVDSTRADPADFLGCNPLTRTRINFALSGRLGFAPDGGVDHITGLVRSTDLAVFSGSSVCIETSLGASFLMRPNGVPVGTNVVSAPSTNASVTFETVSSVGAAGVIPISTPTGALPTGFQLSAGAPYTDVVTTAGVSGTITTCLPYPDADNDGFV